MFNRKRLTGLLLPEATSLYAVTLALGAACLLVTGTLGALAKTPGSTYCYHGTCHRVKTVAETASLIGREEVLHTSFYDDCKRDRYNPCGLTSSGEAFRADQADNAASPIYPDGTTLLIRNPATQDTAVVRVNNAGPYWGKRKLDVSRATAEKLGFRHRGVATLEVRVLKAPLPAEARYRKNRRYEAVPGYIGRFADVEVAAAGLTAHMALDNVAAAVRGPAVTDMLQLAVAEAEAEVTAPKATVIGAALKQKVASAKPKRRSATRLAKSSRAKSRRLASSRKAKSRRMASSRKGYGKRRYASSRKGASRTRYASSHRAKTRSRAASRNRGYSSRVASRGRNRGLYRSASSRGKRVADSGRRTRL